MWSCGTTVQLSRIDVEHAGAVGYGIVPVLSGDFSLCEVRATNFQETYPNSLN